ncbi:phosphoribosyl-AMP cyclohydrolase [Streptococcus hyointestinalis]|uniref:phosphoribosyl-AMP cyclohydrolase n=1 Tax=Streptococcus hyointestinalis TaxID=1337 RepID=UPI003F961F08
MIKLDFDKQAGLIPAIILEHETKDVLMLAYLSEESYQKTLGMRQMWYYSRSRDELWHKGATSEHFQHVESIKTDCDYDTLLIEVEQVGGSACHIGARPCFFNQIL